MLTSEILALDHNLIRDGGDGGAMEHCSKKRNTNDNNNHRISMTLESVPSMTASHSLSSSIDDTVADADADADVSRHLPKRIVTLNAVRPVPKRISEQFYDKAYREGSTLQETHQAAMMAHDWHRKWTHQDEAHHTMPEEDFYCSTAANTDIPTSYCHHDITDANHDADADSDDEHHHATNGLLLFLEREEGAKNPPLESSLEDERMTLPSQTKERTNRTRKHHRTAIIKQPQTFEESNEGCNYEGNTMNPSTEASTFLDSSSYDTMSPRPQVKRQFTGYDNNAVVVDDDASYEYQRPLPIRPVVVRPLAIRANRSEYVLPQPIYAKLSPFAHDSRYGRAERFPQDIVTNQLRGVECVSPLTFSQFTGPLSMSSGSTLGSAMMGNTVLNTEQEGPHFVEDDYQVVTDSNDDQASTISTVSNKIEKARDDILHNLAISDGDVESDDFKTKVVPLEKFFLGQEVDTRRMPQQQQHHDNLFASAAADSIDGMWLTLSKPNFFGNLGQNDNGDPMYTLGRMSFDMFSPTNLICSLQGNFNRIEIVSGEDRKAMLEAVPKKLREEVESGKTVLRTYHVVTAFTIESPMAAFPNAPNKDVIRPIKGIMTTYGYSLPDPDVPNRHSIWFTGGRIEPNNDVSDVLSWKKFFTLHPPKHSFTEKAKLLAVKLLMGATIPEEVDPEDGSMNYVFTRPLGGHGMAYVDVIFMDESLRIVRGQRGTIFVFSRVPDV